MRSSIYSSAIVLTLMCVGGCGAPDDGASGAVVLSLNNVAATQSGEVNIANTAAGTVVMSWLEAADDGVALRFAELGGEQWGAPSTIAQGDNWFVNWADFPSVVPIDDRVWAAHWLVKSADLSYAYDIALALSTDAGRTWSTPLIPHTDGTTTEHGFVSVFPWQGGVGALWLDGRQTAIEYDHQDPAASAMTLRSAIITTDGAVTAGQLVDGFVCDCCQTDVAIARGGPVAVYRNRTADEIRDIYVARNIDGTWQPGEAVANDGWQIAGCPVNGPSIAAHDDRVAVAWFTAADAKPSVRIAFSNDGGASFAAATEIASQGALGRVDTLLLENGDAVLSWLQEMPDGTAAVRLQRVSEDQALAEPLTVATTSAGRLSGFPRLAVQEDRIVVAWTDAGESGTAVRSALLSLDALR